MNDLPVDDTLSRLPAAVPVSRRDLEDIVWPIRVAEDWLLSTTSGHTLNDLTYYLAERFEDPAAGPADLTEYLGRARMKLDTYLYPDPN